MNLNKYKYIAFCLATGSLLLVGLFLLLAGTSKVARAGTGELFVTLSGSGDCSQGSPCDLQSALGTAGEGDTIYIAEGNYTGTGGAVISITKSLNLYGGWDGAPTGSVMRNQLLYPTTLDGEEQRRVVYITGPVTVTLEGLTIAYGKIISTTASGWDGAGLYARDALLTLRYTNFYSNEIDVHDVVHSYAYGGGAAVEGGSLLVEASSFRWNGAWAHRASLGGGLSISHTLAATVTDTLFQDNDAWHAGGLYFLGAPGSVLSPLTLRDSIFLDNGQGHSRGGAYGGYAGAAEFAYAQAYIEGNTFTGSRASNDDGALAVFSSDLLFARNLVSGTQCGRTVGLYLSNVSPFTVTNNIIAGNRSLYSWRQEPAVRVRGGSGQFLHNTIARNESTYGLQVDGGATVVLTNTILVSHTMGITVTAGSAATLEGTLWGSGTWANGVDWGGAGAIITGTVNLWDNPGFRGADNNDYHITPDSAAIDAGVGAGVTVDLDGDPRPAGDGYDIGADEYVVRSIYLPLVVRNYQP